MTEHHRLPAERVQKAAAALKDRLPDYGDLLVFYERLFIAQEENMLQVCLQPIVIDPEALEAKRRAQLPLVQLTEFVFDASAGGKLLAKICEILKASKSDMASPAERIAAAVNSETQVESLFRHLLEGDDAFFEDTAGRIGSDKSTLAFVTYNSFKPSLAVCAQQLATYLKDRPQWRSGICPVCGSLPAIAVLDHDGRRCLHCSFCWHRWHVPRVWCPFCGSSDGKQLSYLHGESDKALRVDCCEKCRKYIKTVDARAADRALYPPLEQVASLHLDIKAREAGYETGILLHLPTD